MIFSLVQNEQLPGSSKVKPPGSTADAVVYRTPGILHYSGAFKSGLDALSLSGMNILMMK
jgi:hypothetical protein